MKSAIQNPKSAFAFTLIELLVVVTIIVVLIAILLPAMSTALEHARKAACLSNSRSIGLAMEMYRSNYNQRIPDRRNWARWQDPADPTKLIAPDHAEAYWGAGYEPFGGVRKLFACPTATWADTSYGDGAFDKGHIYNTYGFNGGNSGSVKSPLYLSDKGATKASIERHAQTVVAMDSYETMLDNNGDYPFNFSQWAGNELTKAQYFRHSGGTVMLWLDGHATHFQPPTELYYIGDYRKAKDWRFDWFLRN